MRQKCVAMAMYEHDVVVVGGGMFGSACARHLGTLARAAGQQLDIALIGAEEPGDRADTEVSSGMAGECEYHPMLCLVASHVTPSMKLFLFVGK